MWEFVDIGKLAIIELSKDDKMGLFEKVEYGRNFDVKLNGCWMVMLRFAGGGGKLELRPSLMKKRNV